VVYVVAVEQRSLKTFTDGTILGTHERMGYSSCINYLMTSSLCLVILFGTSYIPCDPADFCVKTIKLQTEKEVQYFQQSFPYHF
jgi:hypothetical protein